VQIARIHCSAPIGHSRRTLKTFFVVCNAAGTATIVILVAEQFITALNEIF